MAEETDILEVSIVLVGQFNPAIFAPAWFAINGIINADELAATETEVVHSQITRFSIDNLTIGVQRDRFSIVLKSDPIIRIVDIALQVFQGLLPHTPIRQLGINYTEHWRTSTWEKRTRLGRKLAPLEPWGEWGESMNINDPDDLGGLNSLTMLAHFTDGRVGHRQIEIGPSRELTDRQRGVVMLVNHHRETEIEAGEGANKAMEILEAEFQPAIDTARGLIAHIRQYAEAL